MSSYLGQLGALGRVNCGSSIEGHGSTREMALHWTPGGQVGGRRSAHRAPRTWTVRVPIDDGASVHAFSLAASQSSCVWLPADAAGGNMLTPEQVSGVRDYDTPMWSNSVRDPGWIPMVDGRATTNTMLRLNSAITSRNLLNAAGQWAFIPVIPGMRVQFSALLSDPAAAVAGLFRTLADGPVSSFSQTNPGNTSILRRVTASAVAPANAAFVKVRVDGGGRVAEPVVRLSNHAPTGPLDGRGVEAVHVQQFSPTPITVWDQSGSLGGVRSAYEFTIREVASL